MKATINGIEVEGSANEFAELLGIGNTGVSAPQPVERLAALNPEKPPHTRRLPVKGRLSMQRMYKAALGMTGSKYVALETYMGKTKKEIIKQMFDAFNEAGFLHRHRVRKKIVFMVAHRMQYLKRFEAEFDKAKAAKKEKFMEDIGKEAIKNDSYAERMLNGLVNGSDDK